MPITPNEKELVKRLLMFANLKKIDKAKTVEEIFSNIPGLTGRMQSYGGDVNQPRAEQVAVRDALAKIVSRKQKEMEAAIDKINSKLTARVQAQIGLLNGKLTLVGGLLGVEATAWYGIAVIADESRGLRTRLYQCAAPGCGKFNLTLDSRGRPQRHCNEEHRRLADAEPSRNRSEMRRKRELALRLFRDGRNIDFVEGRLSEGNVKLSREDLESLQRKAHKR